MNQISHSASEALRQLSEFLETIDAGAFHHQSRLLPGGTIGAHVRHIIEFYHCLLDGLGAGKIDYDARCRSTEIESSPELAKCSLSKLMTESWAVFESTTEASRLLIRESEDQWRVSSLGRELCFAGSHAMHHLALIGVLAREAGSPLPTGFGVAPSTQRFLDAQAS